MSCISLKNISIAALAAIALTACEDSTSTVGTSLVTDHTEIVVDSSFTITGHALDNAVVQSRTLTQLLGRLDAKEYGSIRSDFVSQFMPAMNIDTEGVTVDDIDSVKLIMFMNPGDFTGDSLAPMGLNVYKLNRQLPSPIYSDFDPKGYYSESDLLGSAVYTANVLHSDSLGALSYRSFYVTLPLELGRQIFTRYKEHPETFANPEAFCSWFPGIYVTNSFGSGVVININETRLNLFYRKSDQVEVSGVMTDTVYNVVRSYLAVTPEVITNNNIELTMSAEIQNMVNAGDAVIVAPTGTEVEVTFPASEIIASFRAGNAALSVLNSLSMKIPAEEIANNYGIEPPAQLLLVLSKDKAKFFADNKITDNKTSFMATYNATTKSYTFSDMRQYILDLLDKENLTAEDYTFTITPVNVETETTSSTYYSSGTTYVTSISPYVTKPAMTKLNLNDAKIIFTFTRQSVN